VREGHFCLLIALGDGEAGSGKDLFQLLENLRFYVVAVVARFDRFFV
jgi:hypothetical protein